MTTILIIISTLIFSAFFSGMEIAFVAANRLKAELDLKSNKLSSKIVSQLLQRPTEYITSMLIGNNISLVVYGLFMTVLLNPLITLWISNPTILLILQTLISTLIILIFAEFLPKSFFISNPNNFLRIFSIPVYFFYIVLFPIAQFTILLSNLFLRIFGLKQKKEKQQLTFGKIDIDYLVSEYGESNNQEDTLQHELKIFQNALDFSDVKLRECMVPRTEIIALPDDATLNTVKQTFITTGLTKILIFKGNIDNIIGYVHSSDLFKQPTSLKEILHKIPIVPETKSAKDLLSQLVKEHKSIAVVVDEFGGTAGIITVEDIIEEIIGEIEDEFDSHDLVEKVISENEFVFSGRMEIDYLNEKYHLNIPESENYETLAGFILNNHANIPKVNEIVEVPPFLFTILKASPVKIELVKLTKFK
ncbi:MAG TPA: HlyC/CorC family transporter [Bacteroidales bacterium]|nr:HlyC/CorC family transporter [Bacteroidales bacterium]